MDSMPPRTSDKSKQGALSSPSVQSPLATEPAGGIDERTFVEKYFDKAESDVEISMELFDSKKTRIPTIKEAKDRLKKQPYQEAIKHLRTISNVICPSDKLVLIAEVCHKIDENVLDFWRGVNVKTEKLHLTAD